MVFLLGLTDLQVEDTGINLVDALDLHAYAVSAWSWKDVTYSHQTDARVRFQAIMLVVFATLEV